MTGMTRVTLDEIRARAEAATEGPWHSHDFGHAGEEEPSSIVVHVGRFDHEDLLTYDSETAVAWMPRWEGQESDNAIFIAHARADVPDLLAEVERLRAALTDLIDEWEDTGRGDSHPLIRGAALSAAGRVRGVLHELLNPTEGEK